MTPSSEMNSVTTSMPMVSSSRSSALCGHHRCHRRDMRPRAGKVQFGGVPLIRFQNGCAQPIEAQHALCLGPGEIIFVG